MSYRVRYKFRFQQLGDVSPDAPNCKHPVYPGAKFCPECGAKVGTKNLEKQIWHWIKEQREVQSEFAIGLDCDGEFSWYEQTKEMTELSKAFPKVLFELTCWGEEVGDYHRDFFLNGSYYEDKASFAPFAVDKLKPYPHT